MSAPMKYPSEHASWRSMMSRAKKGICDVHPRFKTFEEFLDLMGEKPDPTCTLDRIDSADPEYAPGKVRWATKTLQSANRKNAIWLAYQGDRFPHLSGNRLPLTVWAEITAQDQNTMRRRRFEGWSENEVIEGSRSKATKTFEEMTINELADFLPWDVDDADAQEQDFHEFRKPDQDRFSYKLQVIQSDKLKHIRHQFRGVGLYMHIPENVDYWEEKLKDRSLLYGDWCRLPNADPKRWKALQNAYAALQSENAELKAQRDAWRNAVQTRRSEARTKAARSRLRAELMREPEPTRVERRTKSDLQPWKRHPDINPDDYGHFPEPGEDD